MIKQNRTNTNYVTFVLNDKSTNQTKTNYVTFVLNDEKTE